MSDTTTKPKAQEAPEVDHLRGCPAPPDRVESYSVVNPAGDTLLITRCLECAGHTIRTQERIT